MHMYRQIVRKHCCYPFNKLDVPEESGLTFFSLFIPIEMVLKLRSDNFIQYNVLHVRRTGRLLVIIITTRLTSR